MAYRKLKPHTNEKPARNKAIVDLVKEHPEYTYEQIGKDFGITRGRVAQIIIAARKQAQLAY